MPFIDQKEKRASILDEPYAAGILLMLRDREMKGESLLTLSGVKHTVSANYNSVKKILIWMEDMGIIEINQSMQEDHPRPGRPGHNVELTEKGKNIADSLNEVVEYMGQVPVYRKGVRESAPAKVSANKPAKTVKTAKPAPKAAATKPSKQAKPAKTVKTAKPAPKAAATKSVKSPAKAAPKDKKPAASKTTTKKVAEKKKPASSKRSTAKRAKK
ncbi:hypothetical protein [Candidatus Methanomassiliicoccus intestinalis]|uniref:Uncharacterized protein n=1 Tax=Candidatus Methanomassiliicoccus intestinalis TaxID=1406512 RepID=A0A8J8TFC5_9ARCH|nr:MAG: hypothetical protein A3207_00265 [Candidatus Methanomassiliicoccus intestinalis]